ncbi:MAG: amine oxidase [Comamonadaceae bacterium CG1_02_60_18]|nr:MAG: amine oxidase [Comamonadaceae bacterium CG1_02_60_18]PIQ51225.1 MAG: amine oxidase [Comamonadaceae bacterium CG12_big_fil_rev_8_21_14_0_65_59_15]
MAGIVCARTLQRAGHQVTVFEKSRGLGGRMATRDSAFGSFDHGAQYFTVRDARFLQVLQTTPQLCKRWSANSIQVLDEHGLVAAAGLPTHEAHWVAAPTMKSLVAGWAQPLLAADQVQLRNRVTLIERDALNVHQWQLHTEAGDGGQQVFSGFDRVLLAIPSAQAQTLLQNSKLTANWCQRLDAVQVAPCWTLMLAFPQAVQPGLTTLGPQWNAARSTHHRIAWLARESSKPGRSTVERWTVQASAAWSQEHLHDDEARVQAKLIKAFTEVTGIRAEPAHVDSQRWLYAKTLVPLGQSHLWDARTGLGVCGDWCLGHRVEDAFVSGLELALAIA